MGRRGHLRHGRRDRAPRHHHRGPAGGARPRGPRREKAVAYATLASLRHYLLVDPYYRRIDVATRSGEGWHWETLGPGAVVLTPDGDIHIDTLYDEVDAASSTP